MKRRDFLRSAGATAIIPVLPLPAVAVPVAAAPVQAIQLNWAALFARTHAKASPALIQSWLGVGPAQAQAVMSGLVERGIIGAPVAGTAAAVQPIYQSRAVPGTRVAVAKVKDIVEGFVRDALEDDAEVREGDAHEASPDAD